MRTLITGADGYLGRRVVSALLASTDDEFVLAVRAADRAELAAKHDRLDADLGPAALGRVTVVGADLTRDDALAGVDPGRVASIVHAAAVTRFNVDRETAQRVNVDGTVRLARFARRCPDLHRFTLLSTLYTAGRQTGDITERRHGDDGFVNFYEWSKWRAEEHLFDSGLPLSVLRLPTVIAEDDGGAVGQYNAFHNTLKLFYYGLLSLMPGEPSTPLSLGTAAFTGAAVSHLVRPDVPAGVYHVTPEPARTLTLGQLIDVAFTVYERDDNFRRRNLMRPIYCDRQSFDDMVDIARRLKGGPIEQAVASVAPFGTQLYLHKTFRNEALRAAWPGYAAPDPLELVEATCEHLVASRWGRQPVTRQLEGVL
ncbi:SDR family oxidoreductase [Catellatospora sp. NPDC049609]|uniref:SDR family oxidoreductase n=1 Tax=Catellatospora sp. NPDC049609 TaxID=3155505 RepID=UPI003434697B